jgi:endonuclease/exonuclease/phosphatase family metal-dependent hydrolase
MTVMKRLLPLCISACLSLSVLAFPAVSARQATQVNVVTFNMLAPAFARPSAYPPESGPLLDTAPRSAVLRDTVARLATNVFQDGRFLQADVIALQEVQPATLAALFLSGGLADTDWLVFHVAHREDYWSRYYVTDSDEIAEAPWTANYFGHGNALLIRRSTVDNASLDAFRVVLNTEDGNRSPVFTGSINGRPVRITSVHFDGDVAGRRRSELQSHFTQLPPVAGQVDIIAGDFSTDTATGNTQHLVRRAGFVNGLFEVGGKGSTQPYSTKNYSSRNWVTLDHVLTRGATPRQGLIHTAGLFERFPVKATSGQRDDNEDARIQTALAEIGSDHFPVVVRVAF